MTTINNKRYIQTCEYKYNIKLQRLFFEKNLEFKTNNLSRCVQPKICTEENERLRAFIKNLFLDKKKCICFAT